MDRLAFEQLISAWLDDRQNLTLRRQIDAACAADPVCRQLLAEYERLDQIICQARSRTPAVRWLNFQHAVSAEIAGTEPAAADAPEIDSLLRRALPDIEPQIDWVRFAHRVSSAVNETAGPGRVLRLSRWRPVLAVAGLAAAAAVVLWIGLPLGRAPVPGTVAEPAIVMSEPPAPAMGENPPALPSQAIEIPTVAVALAEPDTPSTPAPAPAVAAATPKSEAIVHVRVIEETPSAPAVTHADRRPGGQPATEPEVFFMLEPPDRTVLASAAGFGSH
jgi:hypothetical protein